MRNWTKNEDDAIRRAMNTQSRNDSVMDVFIRLSKSLVGRTPEAISVRWYNVLKKQNTVAPIVTKKVTTKSSIPDRNSTDAELLEYAVKNYPIGTRFKSAITSDECIVSSKPYIGYGKSIYSAGMCIYNRDTDKWAKIISKPSTKQPVPNQSAEIKPKGIFLSTDKLNTLSTNFLRELAVTKLVDLDKKELIDIITK